MRVTVSMSALHLKLVTTFCLCCTALSGPGSSGVEWKDVGGNVTIGCRPPGEGQTSLSLRKSEAQILYVHGKSRKRTSASEFSGRLQSTGEFPDIDIIIKNLTPDDTGAYWCKYNTEMVLGKGSVLLVVTDTMRCEEPNDNLTLVSLLICGAVLLLLILGFLIWIIRKMCTPRKPQRVPGNDVYEDMRATIRR